MKHVAALAIWISCLVLVVIGVSTNLPWLLAENSRLEPWKIPFIWSSELAAFVLFMEYGLQQIVQTRWNRSRITVHAFIVATLLDLGLSAYSIIEENAAHNRALPAAGTVDAGYSWMESSGHTRYTLDYRFHDQTGKQYGGWYSDISDGVPDDVRAAVDNQNFPANIAVSYDPKWPTRSWLADVPYSHDNRLFIYSLFVIMLSVPLGGALALLHRSMSWFPDARMAPFFSATWILCLGAILQGGW